MNYLKLINETMHELSGITLHTLNTSKFKTNTLVLKLKSALTEENVTKRALLPYVLQTATNTYKTSTELRIYLDELYGATLNVDLSKKGEFHIITFRIDIANEKFLKDSTPLLQKAINLLADVLLHPLVEGGYFSSSIVENEKRTLKQRIQSIYDDKMRYSSHRLVEEMCKNEPYRLAANGVKDDVDTITAQNLYEYYEQVLNTDDIHLYAIGDLDEEEVINFVEKAFPLKSRQKSLHEVNKGKNVTSENEVIDRDDVKQGKLNIGYRTNITYNDSLYPALQVFNGIFGGFSHSKLFINVREKESLAYYAASRVESHKGLLLVMSGIDFSNYEKAVKIIKEQMVEMQNGNFTDNEIAQTKAVIKNQILETIDTPRGQVEILYNNEFGSIDRKAIEDIISNIENVTKEDIINVAKQIQLDTIYFLTGKED